MNRSFDLYRAILQRLEDCPTPQCVVNAKHFFSEHAQEIAYHIRMLHEKGLIEATIVDTSDGSGRIGAAVARRLTDGGHDLLDTLRNATLWGKIKMHFQERSVDMTLDLVADVGKRLALALLA